MPGLELDMAGDSPAETKHEPSENERYQQRRSKHHRDHGNPSSSSNNDGIVPRSSSTQVSVYNQMVGFPIMIIFFVMKLMYHMMTRFVGDPVEMVRDMFRVNAEQNKILEEIPGQQQAQQRELHNIHEEQVYQRERLRQLQIRIERLERRRLERAATSDLPPDMSPTSTPSPNPKRKISSKSL